MCIHDRGNAEAPVVILLHSLGTSLHLWDGVAERLSTSFRTIQIDLRGHGFSDALPGPCSIDDFAADIAAIADILNIHHMHVAGASLGGVIALRLGATLGKRIQSLVLIGTALSFPPAEFWRERAAAVRSSGIEAYVEPSISRWVSAKALYTPIADELRNMLRRTDPEGYAAAAEALAVANLSNDAMSINMPALVMVGDADLSTPLPVATALRDALPNARLQLLTGLAHLPPVEAPGEIASSIFEFLMSLRTESKDVSSGDLNGA